MGGEARLGEGGGGAGGLGRQGGSVGLFLRFCCSLWTAGRHRHRVGQISGMFQNSYQCRFASCFCLWPVEPILLVVQFCWLGLCLCNLNAQLWFIL